MAERVATADDPWAGMLERPASLGDATERLRTILADGG
jgi:hypothetical protein